MTYGREGEIFREEEEREGITKADSEHTSETKQSWGTSEKYDLDNVREGKHYMIVD